MKRHRSSVVLQSTISLRGEFELKLEGIRLPAPAADEVVIEMEGAPINPADLLAAPSQRRVRPRQFADARQEQFENG